MKILIGLVIWGVLSFAAGILFGKFCAACDRDEEETRDR